MTYLHQSSPKIISIHDENIAPPELIPVTQQVMQQIITEPELVGLETIVSFIMQQHQQAVTISPIQERTNGDAFANAFAINLRRRRNQTASTSTIGQRRQRDNEDEDITSRNVRQRRDLNE